MIGGQMGTAKRPNLHHARHPWHRRAVLQGMSAPLVRRFAPTLTRSLQVDYDADAGRVTFEGIVKRYVTRAAAPTAVRRLAAAPEIRSMAGMGPSTLWIGCACLCPKPPRSTPWKLHLSAQTRARAPACAIVGPR